MFLCKSQGIVCAYDLKGEHCVLKTLNIFCEA